MSISTKFFGLAIIVVGTCVLMPASCAPLDQKMYVFRTSLSNSGEKDYVCGVVFTTDKDGMEHYSSGFGVHANFWEPFFKPLADEYMEVIEIPMKQLSIEGLLTIIRYQNDLTSPDLVSVVKSKPDFSQKRLDEVLTERRDS